MHAVVTGVAHDDCAFCWMHVLHAAFGLAGVAAQSVVPHADAQTEA